MESVLVSPLVQVVLDKLASGLWKELRLLGGVKKDVRKLQSTLSTIKSVLENAEQRSITEEPLLDWLKKLKDAAYDADDVVDELQTEALRARARGHLKEKVIDLFSSHNPIVFRHKIALKVKDVSESLNDIAEERTKFLLAQVSAPASARNEETHSVVVPSEVYGREEDKEKIVNYLLKENMDEVLSVIAVVGLGGLGKTTLSQLVYNDEGIESLFDLKAWVWVSNEFDVKETARKIVQGLRKATSSNDLGLDPLGQLLREILGGKRFILVLDDVWNEDSRKWESLKSLLSCGEKGSKILLTTRSEDVARVMNSVLLHRLNGLSADDCWRLFRERAFGLGREEESPRLIEIGKKIVNKGGGLPLAAKALGSLMGSKRGENEWLAIENNEIWRLRNSENEILPALWLSYHHLPSHVKKCFVYCSLFPKSYYFKKEKLINLWLGEGFIQTSSEGSQYFNSLLRRSFFDRDEEKDYSYGRFVNPAKYKMHDLIHDLACSAGKDEFCRIKVHEDEVKVLDDCRYLSLSVNYDTLEPILRFSSKTKKLRSLLLTGYSSNITEIAWDTLVWPNYIRLLDLSHVQISVFPSELCRLKHLRFLNLSHTDIEALPSTISNIYNLSTLILANCYKLRELPSTLCSLPNLSTLNLRDCYELGGLPAGMSKMSNLIHLDIWHCYNLRETPPGMGRMTNLQTLSKFVVGEEDGCHITELKHLNQIGGRLEVCDLHKVKNPAEAEEANLGAKITVEELELDWGRGGNTTGSEDESIIENLRPPPGLKVLKIQQYDGVRLPRWMTTSSSASSSVSLLHNLVSLELIGLWRCEGLLPLGHLPLLKSLTIGEMICVRRIGGEEFYGHTEAEEGGASPFPKLEYLEFRWMRNLEEWVVEAGNIPRERMFPSLRQLEIRGCPKLRVVGPGLPMSVKELMLSGSSELPAGCFVGLSRVKTLKIYLSGPSISPSCLEGTRCLTALESLDISEEVDFDGPTTTCLPDGMLECHIPSLRTLYVFNFRSLTSLGQQQRIDSAPPLFTSLNELYLDDCEALTVLPEWIGRLTYLQKLQLHRCPELKMLPDGLQHLTSLQSLHLDRCPKVEMLPDGLQHLTSLQSLRLYGCPKLEMLPDGLQHLTALQHLIIRECPLLQERCVRETGEDWHKIAHIPRIFIQY